MYYADREVSLDTVARHSGYTSSYISRLFKQETGIGIIDYLNAVRIYNAKIMLSDANAKVYQVAESVGYNNYNYFSKMFKKFEGVSPSEYAAQAQV
jgi:two-component system response regulator YesN